MGDPSGQGLAMSYLKNMKRLGKDPVNRILGKQDGAAAIMGTASDLRKLPNKQARANHRIFQIFKYQNSNFYPFAVVYAEYQRRSDATTGGLIDYDA